MPTRPTRHPTSHHPALLLAIASTLALAPIVLAIEEVATLAPSDVEPGSNAFGTSVAIHGDWIAVGAPADNEFVEGAGAAFMFRRVGTTWVQEDKLYSLGVYREGMGHALAMDGEWLVAGAPDLPLGLVIDQSSGVGRAYVYRRNDRGTPRDPADDYWTAVAILNPPPSQLCCNFGIDVDIEGDLIIVGTRRGFGDTGRAYVFHWNGEEWNYETALNAPNPQVDDFFGETVSTNGQRIAIRAHPSWSQGTVHVFARHDDQWIPEDVITVDDVPTGQFLGHNPHLDDDTLAVGAHWLDQSGVATPGVCTFRLQDSAWNFDQRITSPTVLPGDNLGTALAIDQGVILAGDPFSHTLGLHSGNAVLFNLHGSGEVAEIQLRASDQSSGSRFGQVVSTHRGHSVVASNARIYVYRTCESCGTLREFASFQGCFGNEVTDTPTPCDRLDFIPDGLINLVDYEELHSVLIGP